MILRCIHFYDPANVRGAHSRSWSTTIDLSGWQEFEGWPSVRIPCSYRIEGHFLHARSDSWSESRPLTRAWTLNASTSQRGWREGGWFIERNLPRLRRGPL